MSRRKFLEPEIKPRTLITADELTKKNIERFGPKVQISKTILNQSFKIRIPDPTDDDWQKENRKQRTIVQRVTMAELIYNTAKSTQDIEKRVAMANRILDSPNMENVKMFATLNALSFLNVPMTTIFDYSIDIWRKIQQLLAVADFAKDWEGIELQSNVVTEEIFRKNQARVLAVALRNYGDVHFPRALGMHINGPLSLERPFYLTNIPGFPGGDDDLIFEPSSVQEAFGPWRDDMFRYDLDLNWNVMKPTLITMDEEGNVFDERDGEVRVIDSDEEFGEIDSDEEEEGEVEDSLEARKQQVRTLLAFQMQAREVERGLLDEAVDLGLLTEEEIRHDLEEGLFEIRDD